MARGLQAGLGQGSEVFEVRKYYGRDFVIAIKLTENCRQGLIGLALAAPCDDWYASFKSIGENCGLETHLIRRTIRLLARKGLAEYASGLANDDGEFKGAGYRLTGAGWAIVREYNEWKDRPYDDH